MQNNSSSRQRLVDFRLQVYANFPLRTDALFELVDALLLSPILRSAVEVSQSPLFRRCFASVDDALTAGKINPVALRHAVVVAGYAVYVVDTTIAPHPDAATVPFGPRFLKQQLGLLVAHLGDLAPIETWVQVVALAYWQLLLARDLVHPVYRPWDPTARQDPNRPLTPGQVLAAWPIFSRTLETPAAAPRRAGKAPGRAPGERPTPRAPSGGQSPHEAAKIAASAGQTDLKHLSRMQRSLTCRIRTLNAKLLEDRCIFPYNMISDTPVVPQKKMRYTESSRLQTA